MLFRSEDRTPSEKKMSNSIGLKRTKEKETAFLRALDNHQTIIDKICRVYCNNRIEEEDLFQDIVYQLWKAYPSFQNKSKVSTWMYCIALRTAMLPFRRSRVKVEYRKILPDGFVLAEADLTGVHDELYKFFHTLNPVDRAIVAMMMESFSRKEIASVVGISEEAVTMRMSRLRKGINKP